MNNLKQILLEEIPNLKETTLKFINGEISKMEYKGFSGGYGIYAQRDKKSFMIRLRLSSGVISKLQLKKVYQIASKYKVEKIHLTTRQAIQLHGLSVDDLCSIMEEALHKDIYSRGAGGNYPRNVGLSPLSGIDIDDAFDVTPYAVATDKHFMSKITSYHLPRKLKVSFSSNYTDTSHCTVQDLGFIATTKDNSPYFRVFVGGGLGRNPKIALELDELIKPSDVLYYVEGLTKMFIDYGNYENKNKARVRYMVEELGEKDFLEKFKEYSNKEKKIGGLDLYPQPINYNKKGVEIDISDPRLIKQGQSGLYSVYIHPIGGQLLTKDLKSLLNELDKVKDPMIRLAMTEGLYVINLDGNEAKRILEVSKSISGTSSLEQSVSCIGVPICQMGIQNTQKMLNEIIDYFKEQKDDSLLNKIPKLHISGCPNSCGVHQIGKIGLSGKMKNIDGKSVDAFELHIGGDCEFTKTKLGYSLGDYKACDIPKMLVEIAQAIDCDFYEYISKNSDKLNEIIAKYKI
ncbi:nitrite/sulfite reductase [[Clostridium] dakarense]|uniref:nitrite/sulfite reductase n=1 Tax=Faecalimicrobium dakarense TaxID=1301100 RepID=UPI0004B24AA1|nr:nitrite/sulfite reductase [[Clostridium] dakarense]